MHSQKWIYLTIEDTQRIFEIQNKLVSSFENNPYKMVETPHITVFPCIQTENTVPNIDDSKIPESISVTGIHCWPSPNQPNVIALSCDSHIQSLRDSIQSDLKNAKIAQSPKNPHITILKKVDTKNITPLAESRIASIAADNNISFTIKIDDVVISECGQSP